MNLFSRKRRSSVGTAVGSATARGGVDAGELDCGAPSVVEVVVLWGETVLAVAHRPPSKGFLLAESVPFARRRNTVRGDFVVPDGALGVDSLTLVTPCAAGVSVLFPRGASGERVLSGAESEPLSALIANGAAQPSRSVAGARRVELPEGASARIALADTALSIRVSLVRPCRPPSLPLFGPKGERATFVYTAASVLLHVALLATAAFLSARDESRSDARLDRERLLVMQRLLASAAAREAQPQESAPAAVEHRKMARKEARGLSSEADGASSRPVVEPAVPEAGRPLSPSERRSMLAEAKAAALGGVNPLPLAPSDAPPSGWTDRARPAVDAASAARLFEGDLADLGTHGGLIHRSLGKGGGGKADIIAFEGSDGPPPVFAFAELRGPPTYLDPQPMVPRIKPGAALTAEASAPMQAENVAAVVRMNQTRFDFCYSAALRTHPGLRGRVNVEFVVEGSGSVASASDAGSDIGESSVVECVVNVFLTLRFRPPSPGPATLRYPLRFGETLGG